MNTMRTEFSTLDIVKALKGLHREVLRDWMDRQYIQPSVPAQGQGTKAIFTTQDVYSIALFRRLIRCGFSRDVAGIFINRFTKDSYYQKAAYLLVRIFISETDEEVAGFKAIAAEDCSLDIVMGLTDDVISLLKKPPSKNSAKSEKRWFMTHIINFEALRREVDDTLKAL